MAFNH